MSHRNIYTNEKILNIFDYYTILGKDIENEIKTISGMYDRYFDKRRILSDDDIYMKDKFRKIEDLLNRLNIIQREMLIRCGGYKYENME